MLLPKLCWKHRKNVSLLELTINDGTDLVINGISYVTVLVGEVKVFNKLFQFQYTAHAVRNPGFEKVSGHFIEILMIL